MTIPDSGMFFMDTDSSCLPCTPEDEKRIVKELTDVAESKSNLKEGNMYYVLSYRWFMEWQRYVGEDTGDYSFEDEFQQSNGAVFGMAYRPGPIDNSPLVSNETVTDVDDLEIDRNMLEGRDYVLVPETVWKKLHDWYKGGPAIRRKLISQGVYQKNFSVEVFPLCLQLIDSRDNSQLVILISKKASVRELYNRVCTLLELDQEKVDIWDYFNKKKHASLTLSDKTLEEVSLQMDQHILLEMKLDWFQPSGLGMDSTGNELALVPIEPSRSSVTIAGGPTMSNGYSTRFVSNIAQGNSLSSTLVDADDGYRPLVTMGKGEGGGLAGLQNLGNTCFMNSAIQCLVHTPPLVDYFLQDYSEEINKQNPLGMHGELAIAFGELLRKLWSGRAPVAPRQFKAKLARFAPQFSGYNQHDSQELLAFLLDGLHEDLNRVKNKPYIEAKDANDRADEEVANECWENHKARNDSVIVDVCQGQYKSTLVCPLCGKVSVTFDPFMYLSLPLPSLATRSMTITVFYGDGSALPMPYTVTVPKHGCYRDLRQALSIACCLENDESLVLAEVYEHKIFRYLDQPHESLIQVKDDDHLVAYRVPKQRDGFTRLEIVHRSTGKCMPEKFSNGDLKFFGTPLVTCLAERPKTRADIQSVVQKMLFPLLRRRSCLPLDQISMKYDSTPGASDKSSTSQPVSRNQSMENMELEEMSDGELPFHLLLTDERCSSCIPIGDVSIITQGKVIRVLFDWSDREHDLYDSSFLEDLPEVYKSGVTLKKTRQEAISLFSCLEAFLKEEPLGPEDMWYCPTCKEHRQATKKLDLWRLPEILVFHLKRFSYSRYLKNKLDTFVNFPVHDLDLSKYVKSRDSPPQSHLYELYAISNHYGGLGGGHYSAYAKLLEGNQWYHFDDSHVSILNEDEIKTSAAYVLFYRRVRVEQHKTAGESSESHYSSP